MIKYKIACPLYTAVHLKMTMGIIKKLISFTVKSLFA